MPAFGPWMVLESNFRSFGGSWDVILTSWGLILMLLGRLGRSCLALGGSFWESWGHFVGAVGPEGDSVGFWEPFGLHFKRIGDFLG